MDCYCNNHALFWDSCYQSYLLLVEVPLDFCNLKAARISIPQIPGRRNFSGYFSFVLVGCFICVCGFLPVDSKELLLLGRQNPALTHFQSLSIKSFIRKTRMVHIKMSIFSSWFSVLVIIPLWVFYWEENTGRQFFSVWGIPQNFSITELFFFLPGTRGFPTAEVGLWKAEGKVPRRSGEGAPYSWLQNGMGQSYSIWDNCSVAGLFCVDVGWRWQEGNCCGERMIANYFWEWRHRRKWQSSVTVIFLANRNIVTRNNGL